MPRITKVYTRTGDDGTTALGTGTRVPKESLRIAAYGTADELNSVLGVAVASGVPDELAEPLAKIQNDLFHLGSDLCIPEDDPQRSRSAARRGSSRRAARDLDGRLAGGARAALQNFILPGRLARCGAPARRAHGLSSRRARGDRAVADGSRRRAGDSLSQSSVGRAVRDGSVCESEERCGRRALG